MTEWNAVDSAARLHELDRYDLLDTPQEEAFDRITRLVCRLFGVSMSTVSLIDGHRQWFKSCQGVTSGETGRTFALCRLPVADDRPLVVPDTREDARFRDNPFVTGKPYLRFYAGVPVRSASGIPVATLCAMDGVPRAFGPHDLDLLADLGRLVETELELRVQATTDALTQVLARRALKHEAERALALAVRHRHDLSFIVFDVDRFKAVNDTHGHATGDAVLRAVAKAAQAQLRKSDIFGRIGGEEFAIVLPHTGPTDAVKVAEKVRTAIGTESIALADRRLQVTASFGVSWLEKRPSDVDELIGFADQAMYRAKAMGRDRTFVWRNEAREATPWPRKVLKAGQIAFNSGRSVIDCTVRRLSETGAHLAVTAPEDIPGRFKLCIVADHFSRACAVQQRTGSQIEVAFE